MVTNVLVVVAGAMLVTWIGELITEFGIGNGVSLLIFAGIVASVPSVLSQLVQSYIPSELFNYVLYGIVVLIVISPASMGSSPAIICKSVDLPDPLSPVRATASPAASVNDTPLRIETFPKRFSTDVTVNTIQLIYPALGVGTGVNLW